MLIYKANLQKTLRSLASSDAAASPYVAVQLDKEKEDPSFYRSSAFGFIQSKDFSPAKPASYISLSHLYERIKILKEDQIEMDLDSNGILKISSFGDTFSSEMRVHSVTSSQAGLKSHDVGEIALELDSNSLAGIDVSSFKLKIPPVMSSGRLLLATSDIVCIWDGSDVLKKAPTSPRESFLKSVANNSAVDQLVLTRNGYWGAATSDLLVFTYGHNVGKEMFAAYNVPSEKITEFPSERLMYCLRSLSEIVGEMEKITVIPKEGVTSKDRFGSEAKFSLGGTEGFTKFSMFGGTAKAIVSALSQSQDEIIVLSQVSMAHPTLRLRRGPFEVNFKVV